MLAIHLSFHRTHVQIEVTIELPTAQSNYSKIGESRRRAGRDVPG